MTIPIDETNIILARKVLTETLIKLGCPGTGGKTKRKRKNKRRTKTRSKNRDRRAG